MKLLSKFWENVCLALFGAYMLPTLVATLRHHRRECQIGILNYSYGWTVLGWLAALFWALTRNVEPRQALS